MGRIGSSHIVSVAVTAAISLGAVPAATAPADDFRICAQAPVDTAIAACTRAMASGQYQGRQFAALYVSRGINYHAKGEIDRAIADYDEAIGLNLKDAIVYYNRGLAWIDKGDPDRAIADYNEAIRRDSKLAAAYNNRGDAWSAKGDLDRAIADFTEAVKLNPSHVSAFYNRGIAWRKKDELDRAIADFTEAIRLDPRLSLAYNNRGVVWRAKHDPDRAIADFTEAIRLDPKFTLAYSNRGSAYRDQGEPNRAVDDFTEAIRLNPKADSAYLARSLTYFYSGAPAQALADVNQASALDPKWAYNALWVEIVRQRNGLATRLPQTIATIDMTQWPGPVLHLFLGRSTPEAVLAAADHPDSKKQTEKACEANFYVGIMALRHGAKDEAARLYRLSTAVCPVEFPESFAARAELKQLGQ